MSKLIPAPKLLKRWDIMPSELFYHVKNGLQPFDKFERPIPPPTITRKIERLEELLTGLELTSFFLKSFEEPKNAFEKNLKLIEAQKMLNGYASKHESILNKIETLKSDIQSTRIYKLEQLEKLNRKRKTISLFLSAFGSVRKAFEKNPRKANKLIILDDYASRYKSMLNELKTLKRELDNIENIHSWLDYELPENEESADRVIDLLMRSYFKIKDVEAIAKANPETQNITALEDRLSQKESESKPNIITKDATAINTSNYFKRNGDFWTIRYDGKESDPIKHVDGFLYIAHLLQTPRVSISCSKLYQAKIGQHPGTVSAGTAIAEGLLIGTNKQYKSDSEAKEAYMKEYLELRASLDRAESDMERHDIEKEMNSIMQFINEGAFADKNKNKQGNMTKRLDAAYDKLEKSGMKSLSQHLRVSIKPNGAYDLVYNSETSWEISIK
jgi:hypothetical protein